MSEIGLGGPTSPVEEYFDRYRAVNLAIWKAAERGELTVVDIGEQRFHRYVADVGLDADPVAMRAAFEQGMAIYGELDDGESNCLSARRKRPRSGWSPTP